MHAWSRVDCPAARARRASHRRAPAHLRIACGWGEIPEGQAFVHWLPDGVRTTQGFHRRAANPLHFETRVFKCAHFATVCNMLPHVVTGCHMLQCCNMLPRGPMMFDDGEPRRFRDDPVCPGSGPEAVNSCLRDLSIA